MDKLIGKILTKSFDLNVEIIDIQSYIPESEGDNLISWLYDVSIKFGMGIHCDYYSYTYNGFYYNVPVKFSVKID